MIFVRGFKFLFLCMVVEIFSMPIMHAQLGRLHSAEDKFNLALRRTADQLLRASGDSTSRIPAVKQTAENTWRVYIHQPFVYEALAPMLQASIEQYGIKEGYQVAIRQCETDIIDLGFHQQDFLQDSMIPCGGREQPEGCHYIEVTFSENGNRPTWASSSLMLGFALLAGAGAYWLYRRNTTNHSPIVESSEGEWLSFGQSRLHITRQVLECKGVHYPLTYRETKLLKLFATYPGQLLERDYILQQVWADEGVQVGRSIDMFVSRLRKKIKPDPTVGIVAVHGLGYRLDTGV